MQWTVHGRRSIYESSWVSLDLVDVELPDGQRFEQHVVRMARPVAGAAVIRDPGQVLLLWRHRHVTATWGWEIPMGRVEEGESPEQAAAREVEEETGWRPGRRGCLSPPSRPTVRWTRSTTCSAPTAPAMSGRRPTAPRPSGSSGSRLPASPGSSTAARSSAAPP